MATFRYVAKDKEGNPEKGTLEAQNKDAFLNALREKGLYCVDYTEYSEKKAVKSAKIPMKELVILSRQFATMLESGVSLIKCIDILYQQAEDPKIKSILLNVYEDVQKGNALSASLKAQGKAFPNLFISMVECGEESGTLDVTLTRMADHYEKENKLNNKVKNAMVYPMILGVVSVGVVILLLLFVVPTFADMFAEYGDLPVPTKILMSISNFLTDQGLAALALFCAIGIVVYIASRTEAARRWFDKTKLTCPKVGKLNKIIMSSRFAETTATLYATGMSLMEVMEITQRVLNNTYIDQGFDKAKEDVSKGVALSEAMKQIGIFPPMLPNMILIGEESGRLEEILEKTAHYYSEEADAAIQKMVALLEPVMLITLGVIIAVIIGSILPPMYEMMGNIG
ncbi:MAG: type II secretion system F family protein [Cellulosilyticaceae bacterium]